MKYYYKSPEDLKEFLKPKKSTHPFKNRTFLIIFADIVLIVAIATIVRQTGYFTHDIVKSAGRYAREGIEFTGNISNLHKAGQGDQIFFFIKLTNNTENKIIFPADSGSLQMEDGTIEVLEDDRIIKSIPIQFEKKTIKPEKDIFYKFPVTIAGNGEKKPASFRYRVRLPLQGGEILIRFEEK